MPTISRRSRHRPGSRLRRKLRRWVHQNREDLPSFWIGAIVVVATLIALKVLKVL